MNNIVKGILLMLISSVGFAIMTLFVKLAGDLPVVQKMFFRNLISALIAFVLGIYNKESQFGKREKQLVLLSYSPQRLSRFPTRIERTLLQTHPVSRLGILIPNELQFLYTECSIRFLL